MKNQKTNITVTTYTNGVPETKDVTGKQLYAHRSPQELNAADRWVASVVQAVYEPFTGAKSIYIGV